VQSQSSLDLYFFHGQWSWAFLCIFIGHLYFFWKLLSSFANLLSGLLITCRVILWAPYIFWLLIVCRLTLQSSDCFLCYAEVF
jgi:hypothetical protein